MLTAVVLVNLGIIERGEAAHTPGYRLFATNGIRYIIHTVGIRWKGGDKGEIEVMRNCYRNSLRIAKELNCKSISIPLLATGNSGRLKLSGTFEKEYR